MTIFSRARLGAAAILCASLFLKLVSPQPTEQPDRVGRLGPALAKLGYEVQLDPSTRTIMARRGDCMIRAQEQPPNDGTATFMAKDAARRNLQYKYLYRRQLLSDFPQVRPALERLWSRAVAPLRIRYAAAPLFALTATRQCQLQLLTEPDVTAALDE